MIRLKNVAEAIPRYGWNGALRTKEFRSMPCAFRAAWKRQYAMHMLTQVNKVLIKLEIYRMIYAIDSPYRCQVLEPSKDLGGAGGARKVGDERDGACDQNTPDRDAAL